MNTLEVLNKVKSHLETKPEAEWCVGDLHVGNSHCALGHVYNAGILTLEERHILQDKTKEFLSKSEKFDMHAVGLVNDGKSVTYTEPTPKQRVMNFLDDVITSEEMINVLVNEVETA